jgi:polyhydroxyalkanoate synthase subunit PhaC
MTDFAEAGSSPCSWATSSSIWSRATCRPRGYLEARHLQQVFNLMRANNLVWGFVVNSYLLGREPKAFDLLCWYADGTRMP